MNNLATMPQTTNTVEEANSSSAARVHYWELSHYNGGTLIGKWFDLDGVTHEEHLEALTSWLNSIKGEDGYMCEEYIIGDTEGVPSEYVGEWSISEEYFAFEEAVLNSCYDREVFEAAVELGIPLDSVEDAYYGEHESDTELAEEYADSTGMLAEIPENLRFYFDFEAFGRDLAMDFSEFNGHYFNSSW